MKKYLLVLLTLLSSASFASSVAEKYADHVLEMYTESLERAIQLDSDLKTFVESPNLFNHVTAKLSWINAREVYGQTEAFRFYSGPIDSDEGPEGLLNAWPLDENYIDYVVGAPNAGIINNTQEYPSITKELLISLNENDGEKNISTGYHAIEFLLWGQDLYKLGAGRRGHEDYVVGSVANAQRRGEYLLVVSELLIKDLNYLVSAWSKGNPSNYRAEFLALPSEKSLQNIFKGIVFMSGDELSGERMYVAYDTRGQEDEHSCFSDMTHKDIEWNFQGVVNVINATGLLSLPEMNQTALSLNIEKRSNEILEL
uniref:imelysin family protein n=1 Tax=Halobacteriovorax sp. TaxID=2020862 RepID=UPI003565E8B1